MTVSSSLTKYVLDSEPYSGHHHPFSNFADDFFFNFQLEIRGKSGLKIADSETNLRTNSYKGICCIVLGYLHFLSVTLKISRYELQRRFFPDGYFQLNISIEAIEEQVDAAVDVNSAFIGRNIINNNTTQHCITTLQYK